MLTRKWYSIKKKDLTTEKIQEIKTILNVKPFIPKGFGPPAKSFHVYKESDEKLFVPRQFGIEYFGNPKKIVIKDGININVNFNGQLREQQIPVVDTVYKELQNNGHCILSCPTGFGKCHGINTPIIMYDGSIKMVQNIQVGDIVMGDDSTPRNVLSLGRGYDTLYKIIPKKGDSFIVNSEHILCLKQTNIGVKKFKDKFCARFLDKSLKIKSKIFKTKNDGEEFLKTLDKVFNISLVNYLQLPKNIKHILKLYRVGIDFSKKEINFDPYIIGLWLGDGSSSGICISNQDSVIIKYLKETLPRYNMYLQYTGYKYDYRMIGITKKSNKLLNELKKLNLLNNKHIPNIYKINSHEIRLQILAGLIDSDGHYIKKGSFEITQKNEILINDIIYLCRSLGLAAYKSIKNTSWTYKGIKKYSQTFRITISGNLDKIPTKIKRKQASSRKQIKNVLVSGFKIEKLQKDKYYGFTLDGNHKYLLSDFTVTHNTALSLNLVSKINQKALILVHQEFLLNQWIERIEHFLPSAKIGILKQSTIQVDDKDIVIGMIQSICSRKYDVFKQFGFVIIDESHHVSAQYFSQVLYSCGAKYMLGLSATPQRKDGLTKILNWHLGNILTFNNHDIKYDITVECIRFRPKKDEFTIKKSYYGGINIANLTNQICEHKGRNNLIVEQLVKYARIGRQILVLSDRVKHLKDLKQMIPNDISTGLYIGGMTQEDRKISETKTIIFGTFVLIKEAVDIPTLNTLVLTTSKSDIVQAVGRILRKQHPVFNPLIIDIIDEISVFENQYKKRNKFYVKQNYKISDPDKIIINEQVSNECLFD